jgi:hypothetical protein
MLWLAATLHAAAPAFPADAVAAAPKIAVEPASFDFGEALPNKRLTKEFNVRNHGAAELVIESVSTTCGCTAALLDSQRLRPGASARLRVSLETRSYKGALQRSVLIRSNDASRSLLEIKVRATVRRPDGR